VVDVGVVVELVVLSVDVVGSAAVEVVVGGDDVVVLSALDVQAPSMTRIEMGMAETRLDLIL
jgi:hypothetical protein